MRTFSVESRITSFATGDTPGTDKCRVQAADEAAAGPTAVAWVHDNNPRDDDHLEPLVEVLSVEPLPQFVGTFSFGPRDDDTGTVLVSGTDEDDAFRVLDEPTDELRPAIEETMRSKGRDPHIAWGDYEAVLVELADASEAE